MSQPFSELSTFCRKEQSFQLPTTYRFGKRCADDFRLLQHCKLHTRYCLQRRANAEHSFPGASLLAGMTLCIIVLCIFTYLTYRRIRYQISRSMSSARNAKQQNELTKMLFFQVFEFPTLMTFQAMLPFICLLGGCLSAIPTYISITKCIAAPLYNWYYISLLTSAYPFASALITCTMTTPYYVVLIKYLNKLKKIKYKQPMLVTPSMNSDKILKQNFVYADRDHQTVF